MGQFLSVLYEIFEVLNRTKGVMFKGSSTLDVAKPIVVRLSAESIKNES